MDFEYLHLFVKNAEFWHSWFVEKLDFRPIPHKAMHGFGEFVVQHNNILVLLSSERAEYPQVQRFLQRYSEGVGDIAFRVTDLDAIAERIQAAGEKLLQPIQFLETTWGTLRWCRIQGWGSVVHTLLENPKDTFKKVLSRSWSPSQGPQPLPWLGIDHAVLNVSQGQLKQAAAWYEKCLGFLPQQQFMIETPRSGLRSIVLKHPHGNATLPINEPTSDNSQIQEFVDLHRGAGIQHVALKTRNLVQTIASLRTRGLSFLSVPEIYYQQLRERIGFWQEAKDWGAIAQQQILVDWSPETPRTRLLQTFTQPLFDEATFFWEFIERQSQTTHTGVRCAEGFGEGNFRALFEAIEREQELRGSLG
ncbi:4-hydroxyphenylpyruvate dioxygenase [Oscillatoria sp. CS-180]|uniref:4-hydroxyphenylpyruvate dioxygenase n=1 Tax=Oscillatoria sp. CS-180 TaxID=3021720 RepID=UPI00232E0B8B|nr:4-hydroxyphenylpyruvate dioxygenase [Oscillatoria sp. CS-180]MDB9525124.1 4-hydroxyphenylpyruvate dioxygenase [Oscillatoria sp. CS-180]